MIEMQITMLGFMYVTNILFRKKKIQLKLRKGDAERKINNSMNTVPHKEVYFFTVLKDMITSRSDLPQIDTYIYIYIFL